MSEKWEPGQVVYILCGRVDLAGVCDDESEPALDASSFTHLRVSVARASIEDGESGAWVRNEDDGSETWYADRFLLARARGALAGSVIDALRRERDALRSEVERWRATAKAEGGVWDAETWFMETFDVDWVDSPAYANEILRQHVERQVFHQRLRMAVALYRFFGGVEPVLEQMRATLAPSNPWTGGAGDCLGCGEPRDLEGSTQVLCAGCALEAERL